MRTILSIPFGPSDVRTASLMAIWTPIERVSKWVHSAYNYTPLAAVILDSRTSIGLPYAHADSVWGNRVRTGKYAYLVIESGVGVPASLVSGCNRRGCQSHGEEGDGVRMYYTHATVLTSASCACICSTRVTPLDYHKDEHGKLAVIALELSHTPPSFSLDRGPLDREVQVLYSLSLQRECSRRYVAACVRHSLQRIWRATRVSCFT